MRTIVELLPKVIEAYLETHREPGDKFWSVREISKKFDCSKYLALELLQKLTAEKFIERVQGKGCFLRDHVDMNFLGLTIARKHLGFVPPQWGFSTEHNFWTDYSEQMAAAVRKLGWDATFFGNSVEWGDVNMAIRFKLAGCNVMIAVDPSESALITFTELRRAGIPVITVGSIRGGYDKLGVVTIDREERQSTRAILLRLFEEGVRNPLFAGESERYGMHQRYEGCKDAFQEAMGKLPGDHFLQAPAENDQHFRNLRSRLESENPPDALIFNESVLFGMALKGIPNLVKQIKKGFRVVVFDELHLIDRWPKLPIINVRVPMEDLVQSSMAIAKNISSGLKVEPRTLIPPEIIWPDK